MRKQLSKTPLAAAIGTTITGMMLISGAAGATGNPFALTEVTPSEVKLAHHNSCGAGKCGASSGVEGKCGAGKCGANMGGKCGIGKCGGTATTEEPDSADDSGQSSDNQ